MSFPADSVTTLDALHTAIVESARTYFGTRIVQYGAYSPWDLDEENRETVLQTPALLFELEEFEALTDDDERDSIGRFSLRVSCVLHCVLSLRTERLQQTLPQFAAAVAAFVLPTMAVNACYRGNTWGLEPAVEPPERVTAYPAELTPGLNGRDAWIVRWEQIVHLDDALPEM